MAKDRMFEEAKDAVLHGQRARARDLLTRLLRANQSNSDYWLWMSTVVNTEKERIYCLEAVTRLDPQNGSAQRGLVLLGAREAGNDVRPVPPIIRDWSKDIETAVEPPRNIFQRIWINPTLRILSFLGAGVIVIGLILLAVFGTNRENLPSIVRISITPRPTSTMGPTSTPRPTNTLVVRSPTPTFLGPTPLWMFLDATYTPVPLYVNTPHPVLEAYRAALSAYERGDYNTMLSFMKQAADSDPNSADLKYYVGEAHRLLKNYEEALDAYEEAIEINENFAPAYIGRVHTNMVIDPNVDPLDDLDIAIELDPSYVDAYLLRAEYRLSNDDVEGALEDLGFVDSLFPESPLLYTLRAEAYLVQGETSAALQDARTAYDLDITILKTYLVLARAYLVNDNPRQAYRYIEIYTRYIEDDPQAWTLMGIASYRIGRYEDALEAFDKAIEIDDTQITAYANRGLTHLELDDAQSAINDLIFAVRAEPNSFDINLNLGRALYEAGRYGVALQQFDSTENIAQTDVELAKVYYYRAQAFIANENPRAAQVDLEALLDLPEEAVPSEWIEDAESQLLELNPPTSTTTSTRTPLPTATSTPSPTPTSTATSTTTPTLPPTPTSTSTSTATFTMTSTTTRSPMPTTTRTLTPTP